jgi:hypothetical protein
MMVGQSWLESQGRSPSLVFQIDLSQFQANILSPWLKRDNLRPINGKSNGENDDKPGTGADSGPGVFN